ncbi:MAG: HAD family hydrolase [Clostridiales bacterium]|nr:HAD family hydrolase [Clostridiales bacterium]
MEKKTKAIFLDRDGTINAEKNYLHEISEFEFLPGVLDGLHLLQNAGFLLIILTNQSGIARGYYTEEQFHVLNNWMVQTLREDGIQIAHVYYCPHLPTAFEEKYRKNCECRKPKIGMFQQAIKEFHVSLPDSYAIGDKIRDCSICETTLCKGFLIGINEEKKIIEKVKEGKHQRVRYAENLLEAAKLVTSKY